MAAGIDPEGLELAADAAMDALKEIERAIALSGDPNPAMLEARETARESIRLLHAAAAEVEGGKD